MLQFQESFSSWNHLCSTKTLDSHRQLWLTLRSLAHPCNMIVSVFCSLIPSCSGMAVIFVKTLCFPVNSCCNKLGVASCCLHFAFPIKKHHNTPITTFSQESQPTSLVTLHQSQRIKGCILGRHGVANEAPILHKQKARERHAKSFILCNYCNRFFKQIKISITQYRYLLRILPVVKVVQKATKKQCRQILFGKQ